MAERLCNARAPHGAYPTGLVCLLPTGHAGPHAAELIWTGDDIESWTVIEPAVNNVARRTSAVAGWYEPGELAQPGTYGPEVLDHG